MSEQEPYFYLQAEINQAIVYTEDDAYICDLDCEILNNCRQGIVPQVTSFEEV